MVRRHWAVLTKMLVLEAVQSEMTPPVMCRLAPLPSTWIAPPAAKPVEGCSCPRLRSTPMSRRTPYTRNRRDRYSPSMMARGPWPTVAMVTVVPAGMVICAPPRT